MGKGTSAEGNKACILRSNYKEYNLTYDNFLTSRNLGQIVLKNKMFIGWDYQTVASTTNKPLTTANRHVKVIVSSSSSNNKPNMTCGSCCIDRF